MIDKLFGSKTRIKLLHLFYSNPGKAFYVREITRIIGEQINSVRRELSNMLEVGVIQSNSVDNRLYYEVNIKYEYYAPLKLIFSDKQTSEDAVEQETPEKDNSMNEKYTNALSRLSGARIIIFSGFLIEGSSSSIDMLFVGNIESSKLKLAIKEIERIKGKELNYTVLPYDDFYYRLSIRDKFITDILNDKHEVMVDKDNILNSKKENR